MVYVSPAFFASSKAVGSRRIVRLHAQKTAHQRPVRAVPRAGLRKRAVQVYRRLHRRLAQQRRAIAPIRAAPAVWELDGPIITGPSMSKISNIVRKLLS